MLAVLTVGAVVLLSATVGSGVSSAQVPDGSSQITGRLTAPDGTAASGVWVSAYRDGDTWIGSANAATDADGNFSLDLEPGVAYEVHFITFPGSGFVPGWVGGVDGAWVSVAARGAATDIVVDDAQPARRLDVTLGRASAIVGTITDAFGMPLPGARVLAFRVGDTWVPSYQAIADAEGRFRVDGVAPSSGGVGDVQLLFVPPDGSTLPWEWFDDVGTNRGASTLLVIPAGGELRADARLGTRPPTVPERTVLGTLGGSNSQANAVNDGGVVVGSSLLAGDQTRQAFRWDPVSGDMVALGTLGGSESNAQDVNDGGTIVGTSSLPGDGATQAFVLDPDDDVLRSLGTLGGTSSEALAVNEAGVIVGWSDVAGDEATVAFRWDPSDGEMVPLTTEGATGSIAFDVADDGTVVGEVSFADQPSRAFVWTSAEGLQLLDGDRGAAAQAINAGGTVVGDHTLTDAIGYRAATWSGAAGTAQGVGVGGEFSTLYGINDDGIAVGQRSVIEAGPPVGLPDDLETVPDQVLPSIAAQPFRGVAYDTRSGTAFTFESDEVTSVYRDVSADLVVGTVGLQDGTTRALVQPLTAGGSAAQGATGAMPVAGDWEGPPVAPAGRAMTAASGAVTTLRSGLAVAGGLISGGGFVLAGGLTIAGGAVAAGVAARRRQSGSLVHPAFGRPTASSRPRTRLATAVGVAVLVATGALVVPTAAPAGAAPADCDPLRAAADQREAAAQAAQDKLDLATAELTAAQAEVDAATTALDLLRKQRTVYDIVAQAFADNQDATRVEATDFVANFAGDFFDEQADGVEDQYVDDLVHIAGELESVATNQNIGRFLRGAQRVTKGIQSLAGKANAVAAWVEAYLAAPAIGQMLGHALMADILWAVHLGLPDPSPEQIDAATQETAERRAALSTAETDWDAARAEADEARTALAAAYDAYDQCAAANDLPPADRLDLPPLPPHRMRTPGVSLGDPHMVTLDGLYFDFHAAGEYWQVRSIDDLFGVQMRTIMDPLTPVAWMDGVAVRTPSGHTIAFESGGVWIDDELTEVPAPMGNASSGAPVLLDDDSFVVALQGDLRGGGWRVELFDGTRVTIGASASMSLVHLGASRAGRVEGVLGNDDGDVTNDGANAAGTVVFGDGDLATDAGFEAFYGDFAPSWQVSDADRIFTGVRRPFTPPATSDPLAEFPQAQIDAAEQRCRELGYDNDPLLTSCVFDLLVTGVEPASVPDGMLDGISIAADGGNTPQVVALKDVSSISAAAYHTCAVGAAGQVYCWGANLYGTIGDGTTTTRSAPTAVVGLPAPVTQVTANAAHSCALTDSGAVWCWGYNPRGEVGDGTTVNRSTPVEVVGLPEPVVQVDAGDFHTCARMVSGTVWCWGSNQFGELGIGPPLANAVPVPHQVVGLPEPVAEIDAGDSYTCARTVSGAAWCWGSNGGGRLGDGTTTMRPTPVAVVGLPKPIAEIDASSFDTCARTVSGAVWCWGYNPDGLLGDGTTTDRLVPGPVVGLPEAVVEIDGGQRHNCVRTVSGAVWCWGRNTDRQLGDGTVTSRLTPVAVVGLPGAAAQIAAGDHHTCARLVSGTVWCWGSNGSGQLGDGTVTARKTPVQAGLPT